jgi:hypothetical protein
MLFNCLSCAKTISTKMDFCPYCECSTVKAATRVEFSMKHKETLVDYFRSFKGTIFAALFFR